MSLVCGLEEFGQVEMRLVNRDGDRLRLIVGGFDLIADHNVDVVVVVVAVIVVVVVAVIVVVVVVTVVSWVTLV